MVDKASKLWVLQLRLSVQNSGIHLHRLGRKFQDPESSCLSLLKWMTAISYRGSSLLVVEVLIIEDPFGWQEKSDFVICNSAWVQEKVEITRGPENESDLWETSSRLMADGDGKGEILLTRQALASCRVATCRVARVVELEEYKVGLEKLVSWNFFSSRIGGC